MDLYNPPNLNLPALKIKKVEDRRKIESDPAVKNLIASKLLLNKDLNQLLVKLLGLTKNINKLLETKDDYHRLSFEFHHIFPRLHFTSLRFLEFRAARELKKGTRVQRQELEEELKKKLKDEHKKINQKLKNEINKLSNQLQSELDSFERKHKTKLNISESLNLYICKECKKIFCQERFHADTCECGKTNSSPSNCVTIIVHRFGKNIIKFIEDNWWLEHGIDHLLRKKNFNTQCGFYILGHSGIEHEIDNLAEMKSDNLRIFCECKTTDINVNDVFVFAGKMADIGCTRGYIFTTSFETSKKVKHLARSKNITIIDEVLEKDETQIIKGIKEITEDA